MKGILVKWSGYADYTAVAHGPSWQMEFCSVLIPERDILLTPRGKEVIPRRRFDDDSFEEFGEVEVPSSVVDAAEAFLKAQEELGSASEFMGELVSTIPIVHPWEQSRQIVTAEVVKN